MDTTLTQDQRLFVEKAQWVAKTCLEPRAAQYDELATHPTESWKDLWENGLLAIAVPERYGGLGLDMVTYVRVIEELSKGCTNTAMTLHMHSVVQRFIDALGTSEQKARFYPDVVERGRLFGSWGSEPESRGGTGQRLTKVSPVDGGFVIDGQKHFCTMAGGAYRYMVHSTMDGHSGIEGYQLALIPHDVSGLEITGDWNTLGMRGTVSPSVSFRDCFVEADCLLGEPGEANKAGVGQGFGLGYAAVYIGAAQRALDFTVDYCKTHRFEPDPVPLSHSLVVQRHVAEMTMALEGARLAVNQSASRWEEAGPVERYLLAARAKYPATQAALMVTSMALRTVGGRSAHRRYPLDRLFRDVRTCTLMPPNADRALELIGKTELGVEDEGLAERFSA